MQVRLLAALLMTLLAILEGNTQLTTRGTVVHNECMSSQCPLNENNLAECLSGHWNCSDNEYCEIQFSGQYTWYCKPILPGWACQIIGALCDADVNSPGRLQYRYVCYYCCYDAQCMYDFHGIYPSTPPRQGPTPSPTTALIQGTVVHNECMSSQCPLNENNLAECLSGHWNCSDNEYCEIQFSGQYTWYCNPIPPEGACQIIGALCDADVNSPGRLQYRYVCYYCCYDAQCMYDFHGIYPSTPTRQGPNPSPTTALIQGTVVLNDCFSPRCTIELDNLADCLSGHWNCSDNEYCLIEYSGQYTWACNPLPHAQLCQERYSTCPPRIPAGFQPRQICHYCCDDAHCMYDFHGIYQETSSQVAGLTTVAPTGTSNAICVQCGDYDRGIPCSTMELLFDTPIPCPMSGQNFCMTDTIIDSNGVASVFKRCVDQPTCESLWYLDSRELIACRNFDSATTGAACHFCCIGDGCNMGAVPPGDTLYKISA